MTSLTFEERGDLELWIGDYAFEGCSSLTSVEIPKSVTSIGSYAFYNCTNLLDLHIGNQEENNENQSISIGHKAFGECGNLKTLTINKTEISIEEDIFESCVKLDEIKIDIINQPNHSFSKEQFITKYKNISGGSRKKKTKKKKY